jgi:hypothetical protein
VLVGIQYIAAILEDEVRQRRDQARAVTAGDK